MSEEIAKVMRKNARAVMWAASQIEKKGENKQAQAPDPVAEPACQFPDITVDNLTSYVDHYTILAGAAVILAEEAYITRGVLFRKEQDARPWDFIEVRANEFAQSVCLAAASRFEDRHRHHGADKALRKTEPLSTPFAELRQGMALDVIGKDVVFRAVGLMISEIAKIVRSANVETIEPSTLEFCANVLSQIKFDKPGNVGDLVRALVFLPEGVSNK